MMVKKIVIALSLFASMAMLSACQDLGKGGREVVKDAKVGVKNTEEAIKELLYYKPEVEEYKPIPYTFCYQVMQDINCYNQPMPEARGRLIGWQGRGQFKVEDPMMLPAKTALVRQPRAASTKTAVEEVLEDVVKKKKEKPELVSLEPVYIPEAPKVKPTDKVVTIKVTKEKDSTLY